MKISLEKTLKLLQFFGLLLMGLLFAMQGSAAPAETKATDTNRPLRFLVFADIHYVPGEFPHDGVEWLDRILERAKREHCDLILQLGDMCHVPSACGDYLTRYNQFEIPTYHVLGNHDDDGNPHTETLKAYGLARGYYHFDRGGFRFVIMDTNYCEKDGHFTHYSSANYYSGYNSTTRVPPEQLEWLKRTLDESPFPCIIASHGSFERDVGGSPDGPAVRAVINAVNAAHPGRVRLVLNGHHHHDYVRILDQVIYFDVNSASYDWRGREHNGYPAEYEQKWKMVRHTVMWDDPLSAVITIAHDGTICVEGQKSQFHLGLTPEQLGVSRFDEAMRPTTPEIQSFRLKMEY